LEWTDFLSDGEGEVWVKLLVYSKIGVPWYHTPGVDGERFLSWKRCVHSP